MAEHDSTTRFGHSWAVEVAGLNKWYGRGDKRVQAVNDVSLRVARGEIVGLLGPNGAGKTTLIKCILNLVRPDSGVVRLLGMDVGSHPNDMYRHVTGVLEGARNTYWRMSVRENIAFFAGLQGIPVRRRRAFHDELMERLDLTDKADATVNELSQGMKQKVAIACAFARETEILFLDEPTLGLDLHASHTLRESLKQLAQEQRRTIVLSSHDMDVVQNLCERVIIVNKGRVVADDRVDNLVSLFRAEAYRIHVATALDESVHSRLADHFSLSEWNVSNLETTFEANVRDGDELYALIDELRSAKAPLVGIAKAEPDLAQVFMRMTGTKQSIPGSDAGSGPGSGTELGSSEPHSTQPFLDKGTKEAIR